MVFNTEIFIPINKCGKIIKYNLLFENKAFEKAQRPRRRKKSLCDFYLCVSQCILHEHINLMEKF